MRSPYFVCVCPLPTTLNQLVDFHEILYEGHVIEGDHDCKISNLAASTIPRWRTFKFLSGCKTLTTIETMTFYMLIDLERMYNFWGKAKIQTINIIFTNNFSTHLLVYHTRFSHQVAILSGSKKLIIWFIICE
jgi:hypothetical protein